MTNFEKYRNPILQINKRGIIIYCNLSALEKFEWTQLVNKSCLVLIEESLRNMHQEIFKNEKDNSYYNFNITVNVLSENFDTNKWNMNILPYEEGWICFFSPITELQKKVDMNIRLNNHINSFLEHELKQKFAGISLSIENILSINDGENIVIKRDELKELMFISNRGKELCFNSIIQRKIFDDTYEITKTYFPIKNLYSYIDVDTQVISNNPIIEENLEKISLKADWNLIHHIVDNTLVNSKIHGYDIKICWEINENGIIYQIKNKVLPIKTFEKSNGIGKEIIKKCCNLLNGKCNFEIINDEASYEIFIPNDNDLIIIDNSKTKIINKLNENTKILLLDDEKIMRKTSQFFIEKTLNCKAFIFGEKSEDCENIFDYINKIKPDIVILDENLSYIDKIYKGSEICKQLKDYGFDKPVLIRSAYDDQLKENYFKKMGADGLLRKSLNVDQMKSEINKIYNNI